MLHRTQNGPPTPSTKTDPFLTLPNVISLGRIALAPISLWWAWTGAVGLYRAAFSIAIASDLLDGAIARLFKNQTEWGARLDTLGDTLTYLVLFFAVCWLWPELVMHFLPLIVASLILYTAMFAHGFLKFGRLSCYHSWGGKISAAAAAVGMLIWMYGGPEWPFGIALVIALIAALEEILITAFLPHWKANVPTCWHAWKLRKQTEHKAEPEPAA